MKDSKAFVVEGVVMENLPNTTFRVKIDAGAAPEVAQSTILCHLAGKMRINWVKLLPGDRVRVEINPIDTSKGRIVFKLRY